MFVLGYYLFGWDGGGLCEELVVLKDYVIEVLGDFWEGVCDFTRGVWEWVRLADYLFWGVGGIVGIVGSVVAVIGHG